MTNDEANILIPIAVKALLLLDTPTYVQELVLKTAIRNSYLLRNDISISLIKYLKDYHLNESSYQYKLLNKLVVENNNANL